jgi:hypothetical protein
MTRLPNRRANRRSSGNGFGADGGDFGGSGGRSLSHWFGGDHSALDVSAVRSTSAAAIVEAAAIAEEAVIDAAGYRKSSGLFDLPQARFFRFILVCITHHFGIT